jgi:hypothetical protein
MSTFKEQLEIGRRHERAVALGRELRNYALIPLTDITNRLLACGGAPRMFDGYGSAIVLPDFAAIGFGRVYPLEVKAKTMATFHKQTKVWEHGVDLHNYRHYCAFALASGLKLILIIDEGHTGEILAASLERLGEPRAYYGETGRPPMVYWPRDSFTTFHQGEPNDLPLFRTVPVAPTLPRSGRLEDV